jgi:predicted transcriptional regulator
MAIADDRLWNLHLQKAIGNVLTPEEQADLEAWYAAQDRDELVAQDEVLEQLVNQQAQLISEQRSLLSEQRELLRRLLEISR